MRGVTGVIHAVRDRLRDEALDERDEGSESEQLIRAHLSTDPDWTTRFSDVWLWSDRPGRAGRPDTGIDRYRVQADESSGIVNDPNDWSREAGDPRHVLDLLARIVTVSLETMRIVHALPALDIRSAG